MFYKVKVSFLAESGEECLDQIFKSDSLEAAIEAAKKYAENRFETNREVQGLKQIGCIKLWPFSILGPEEDGRIRSGTGKTIYEWKCDRYQKREYRKTNRTDAWFLKEICRQFGFEKWEWASTEDRCHVCQSGRGNLYSDEDSLSPRDMVEGKLWCKHCLLKAHRDKIKIK
jgi:hypothetical protein